jgi:predicted Zn finger-like uncharacterized protein
MPAPVEIQCPHCAATLKLKSRDPLGKKVKCPKCAEPFVAKERPRTAQVIDDYDDYAPAPAPRPKRPPRPRDEFDDFDDPGFEDDFGPPPRSSAGGGRRKKPVKKKKQSSRGALKWVFIGGGIAGGVGVLILGIWLAFRMFGSKKLDLAWLPEDANSISVARIGELWKSDLVQYGMDVKVKDAASKMKDDWGFGPQDIVSVTNANSRGKTLKVLRTSVDLDEDKILKHAGDYEKTTIDGQTAYRMNGGMMVFFPDKRTAISGTEDAVTGAIRQGPKAIRRDELDFVDAGYHIVNVNMVSDSGVKVRGQIFGMDLGKVRGNFTGVSITSSVKTASATKFASAADAAEVMEKAEKMRKEMEEKMRNALKNTRWKEDDWKELKEDTEKHVSTSHSGPTRRGDTIHWTATAKPLSDKFKKLMAAQGVGAIGLIVRNPAALFSMPFRVDDGGNPFGNRNPFDDRIRNRIRNQIANIRRIGPQPASRQVWRYGVELNEFNGPGNREAAARNAVANVNGVDQSKTRLVGNTLELESLPGHSISTSSLRQRLRVKGFLNVTIKFRGVR